MGSALKATDNIKKTVGAFTNADGLTQLYPKSSIAQVVKPFKNVAKAGTAVTAISTAASIADVWTEDSGNTTGQKWAKTGVKIGQTVAEVGVGTVNVAAVSALGLAEPETGGLSTWGIVAVAGLDVAESQAIQKAGDKLLSNMGIK